MMKKEIRISEVCLLLVLAFLGMTAMLWATRWGIGLLPDSSAYVGGARSLLKGSGYRFTPAGEGFPGGPAITQWPPCLSFALALIGLITGLDPADGCRALHVFFFAANALFVGWVLLNETRSFWFSAAGVLFMLTSPSMLYIHSAAYSEPLYIFLGLWGLWLLSQYLKNPSGRTPLVVASLFMGLAFLTRYAGASLIFTGLAVLWLWNKGGIKRKIVDGILFTTLSCFPILFWFLRNFFMAGSFSNRDPLAFHPPVWRHANSLFSTLSTWLVPAGLPAVVRGIVLLTALGVVLAALAVTLFKRRRSLPIVLRVLAGFIVFNFLFYVFSITFIEEAAIDDKTLAPWFFAGVILVLSLAHSVWIHAGPRLRTGLVVFFAAFSAVCLVRAGLWLNESQKDGRGYSSRAWKESETMLKARSFPPSLPLYSNGPDVIPLLAGRWANGIPAKGIPGRKHASEKEKKNPGFSSELEQMRETLRERGGVVIWFDRIDWRYYYPTEKELEEVVPLRLEERLADGSIYTFEGE